jgi:peptidoglycan/LPS O-acetylase OafA/YrhL
MVLARQATAQPACEIRALNTIRGVAALAVAVFHAPMIFGVTTTLPHAYLAVDLFFVLSGFVMVHAYEERLIGGLSFGRFLQLRLARLYPLLVLATLAGFAVFVVMAKTGHATMSGRMLVALPLNLAMLPMDEGDAVGAFPFCAQSWSILWEVLLCMGLFAWRPWARRGAVVIAATAGCALALVAMSQGKVDGGWTGPTFWIGGFRALSAFSAGVVVRLATRQSIPVWLKALAAVAGLIAGVYMVAIPQTTWWSDYLTVAVAFPLIIAGAAGGGRLLETWLGDRLGEASYSVYLLHNLSIEVLNPVGKVARHYGAVSAAAFDIAWMASLVVGAWLCWRWVEMPLRRLVSGWAPSPVSRKRLRAALRLDAAAEGA